VVGLMMEKKENPWQVLAKLGGPGAQSLCYLGGDIESDRKKELEGPILRSPGFRRRGLRRADWGQS